MIAKDGYSKQYKATIRGKLRKDLETYMCENEMRESEVLREALKKFLEEKQQRSPRITKL